LHELVSLPQYGIHPELLQLAHAVHVLLIMLVAVFFVHNSSIGTLVPNIHSNAILGGREVDPTLLEHDK
jgi:hypothetical protein